MNNADLQNYIIVAAVIGFFAYRYYKSSAVKKQLPSLLKQGAVIVDVRSAAEFSSASNAASLNIPLNEIESRIKELDKNKTIILCCASGARSGMALGILKAKGFNNVMNAGSWTNTMEN